MPPEFGEIKEFLTGLDPRVYTTPLGAVMGLAAVRMLSPKYKRTWKRYGLGAGIGAGVGLAAGTVAKAYEPAKKIETPPDIEPRAGKLKPKEFGEAPGEVGVKKSVATEKHLKEFQKAEKLMSEIIHGRPATPEQAKVVHSAWLANLPHARGNGLEAFKEPIHTDEWQLALAAGGGKRKGKLTAGDTARLILNQAPEKGFAALLDTPVLAPLRGLWDWGGHPKETMHLTIGDWLARMSPNMQAGDWPAKMEFARRARELARSGDPADRTAYEQGLRNSQAAVLRALGKTAAIEARIEHLTNLKKAVPAANQKYVTDALRHLTQMQRTTELGELAGAVKDYSVWFGT
jgi:hypothetical protein